MRVSTPSVVRGLSAAVVAFACCANPALAGWSADPVTITPTTASIPLVEGCADGAYGAFAAWQEGSPTGILRVQHLLPNGDLDSAWPALGAVACNIAAARTELVALPDRLGGVYLLWKEGNSLYVTRLDPGGAVASGWPARGRSLGAVLPDSPRPSVIEDGANGFYAAWTSTLGSALGARLGPANTGTGGWPSGARTIVAASYPYETMYWPQIAAAPDGGIFVAWAAASTEDEAATSAWRVRRLAPSGVNASGWPEEGLSFGPFLRSLLGSTARGSLLGLGSDGRGGAFLMIGDPVGPHPYYTYGALIETRLYRLQGDGQGAADWPVAGAVIPAPDAYISYEAGASADYSYSVEPDGRDGAFAGVPGYQLHFGPVYGFSNCDRAANCGAPGVDGLIGGREVGARGDGGLFLATFYPTGPTGPYQPGAFIRVGQTPPGSAYGWTEGHPDCCVTFYTDIGLAPTGDGGAVFLWSQVRERIGLFARRFNPAGGEVTAVEPVTRYASGLSRLRFVPGVGVRAAVGLSGSGPARFELFDVAGRRIVSQPIEAHAMPARDAAVEDVTLAGTAELCSGLYFGRLVEGGRSVAAKLIVAR